MVPSGLGRGTVTAPNPYEAWSQTPGGWDGFTDELGDEPGPEWWQAAVSGQCSHGGHGWDGETCNDDAADYEREPDYENDSDCEPLVFADESEYGDGAE